MPCVAAPVRQRPLGEDDIGVVGRVAVAGPVAHEDDGPPGSLVAPDPLALAGAADEAGRVAVGEGHAGATPAQLGRVGGHGQVGRPSRASMRSTWKPTPSLTISMAAPDLLHDPHEVHERLVQRDGIDDGVQRRRVARQDLHVPGGQLARALAALVVELVHVPHRGLVGHELPQQGVADILEADGAVEVDEEADRRR